VVEERDDEPDADPGGPEDASGRTDVLRFVYPSADDLPYSEIIRRINAIPTIVTATTDLARPEIADAGPTGAAAPSDLWISANSFVMGNIRLRSLSYHTPLLIEILALAGAGAGLAMIIRNTLKKPRPVPEATLANMGPQASEMVAADPAWLIKQSLSGDTSAEHRLQALAADTPAGHEFQQAASELRALDYIEVVSPDGTTDRLTLPS